MARKFPKSLTEAIKVIKDWEHRYCMLHNSTVSDATHAGIQQQLDEMTKRAEDMEKRWREAQKQATFNSNLHLETRKQFDDLKERIHTLEIENAVMTGYLNRVQEDDEVREELVTVGEPGGEQQLVPKRKPRLHRTYTSAPTALYDADQMQQPWRERPKSKHWVNY